MATLSRSVDASANDANETAGGGVTITATISNLAAAGAWAGFRFVSIDIDQGETVDAAAMEIYSHSATSTTAAFDIFCESTDNPPEFTINNNDISNRPRTTAKGDWDQTSIPQGYVTTVDLSAPIQERISDPDWVSGQALVFIYDAQTGVNITFRFWDFVPTGSSAPNLDIDYTESAAGQPIMRRWGGVPGMNQYTGRKGW